MRRHAVEALTFQLTMLLVLIVAVLTITLPAVLAGLREPASFLFLALALAAVVAAAELVLVFAAVVLTCTGTLKATRGQHYRIPAHSRSCDSARPTGPGWS